MKNLKKKNSRLHFSLNEVNSHAPHLLLHKKIILHKQSPSQNVIWNRETWTRAQHKHTIFPIKKEVIYSATLNQLHCPLFQATAAHVKSSCHQYYAPVLSLFLFCFVYNALEPVHKCHLQNPQSSCVVTVTTWKKKHGGCQINSGQWLGQHSGTRKSYSFIVEPERGNREPVHQERQAPKERWLLQGEQVHSPR